MDKHAINEALVLQVSVRDHPHILVPLVISNVGDLELLLVPVQKVSLIEKTETH